MPLHATTARQASIWTVLPHLVRAKDAQQARQLPQDARGAHFAHQGNIPRSDMQRVSNALKDFFPVKVQLCVRVALQVPIAPTLPACAQCVLQAATRLHLHQSVLSAMQGTSHRCMRLHAKVALQVLSAMRKLKRARRAPMEPLQLRGAQLVRRP